MNRISLDVWISLTITAYSVNIFVVWWAFKACNDEPKTALPIIAISLTLYYLGVLLMKGT